MGKMIDSYAKKRKHKISFILVYFFLFDRKNIIEGCLKIIPGNREMLSKVWTEMDIQLSNYVRGKVLEIIIVAIAAAILSGTPSPSASGPTASLIAPSAVKRLPVK